ncbi:hypothetical protein Athai_36960 [Actinocatenispora thailandica]|uniref:UspA domain-containing protein n=1 Tax=Actinocatenispora thailandica TaxID=227318 RepID=A0A7R7DQX7_9ACTN|nr:universal stress protein [Actinocatenispora thailandica]BCJ36193.1 hypothetical protein Athai_36960 [Actinocatenispora thailandica]
MRIVAWLLPGTWESVVDAAGTAANGDDDVVLLATSDDRLVELAGGADEALLGRGGPDPLDRFGAEQDRAAELLLDAAAARLGRRADRQARRSGHPERDVVAACDRAGLLVLARDGDHTRLGPPSIAPPTRFVLDHAPCRVLLVWPDEPPDLGTLPPAPPHPPAAPRPPHPPAPPRPARPPAPPKPPRPPAPPPPPAPPRPPAP